MAYTIKFGTDGWRAIIADKFTVHNVARLTMGLAIWAKQHAASPKIAIGYDCRFGGKLFTDTVAKVLISQGVQVLLSPEYVSTPALSLATRDFNCTAGVVITASHNPPSYSGFKLKASFGGPMQSEDLAKVESSVPDDFNIALEHIELDSTQESLLTYQDIEGHYIKSIEKNFDLAAIRNANLGLAYDGMYGSGQNVMRKILPGIKFFRCEENPSFNGLSPEPILRNLLPYAQFIAEDKDIKIGLATDGDADRIGLMDEDGSFVDSHHIMLLLIHYLHKYKGKSGKVVIGFSSVNKLKKLCAHYDLPVEVVKIGFKYAAGIIIKEKVLVGGEESGGIAVEGHIPERDGIWMGLMLWEFMATSGKTLRELIDEVYDIVGPFNFKRDDLHLDQSLKEKIVANCQAGKYESFGPYTVTHIDDLDGWKYHLSEDSWIMIRPSGTEPVLRIYCEARTDQETTDIIEACKQTILNQDI